MATKNVNKMSKKELLKEISGLSNFDMIVSLGGVSKNPVLQSVAKRTFLEKHLKKLGLTLKDYRYLEDLQEQAKHGYSGFMDPLLQAFYKARETYSKISGKSHYEVQSMVSKGFYDKPGYKGIDMPKKAKKIVDKTMSPLKKDAKEFWDMLKKEFDKGKAGVD